MLLASPVQNTGGPRGGALTFRGVVVDSSWRKLFGVYLDLRPSRHGFPANDVIVGDLAPDAETGAALFYESNDIDLSFNIERVAVCGTGWLGRQSQQASQLVSGGNRLPDDAIESVVADIGRLARDWLVRARFQQEDRQP